ncbi:hypothetical protein TWF225_009920 [Orbilia oligospora]|nr:hypothetical protein TWF225_009920 [Orbilia oligospora]KAF3237408.1 hypothetical protein TWF217_002130 [Orbilia oligospora]KAF3240302.1 hypothetical protein TWF128_011328 [Orbilia oligospora]
MVDKDVVDGTRKGPQSLGLTAVHNCRDVGATINHYYGEKIMKEGLLFRSGRLDHATPGDMEILTLKTQLTSILDLRTKTERDRVPTKNPNQNPVATVSGAKIYHIPYLSDQYTKKALLSQLPWYRLIQVLFCHFLGLKTTVVRLISTLVIVPLGLKGIAYECLRWLKPEIKETLTILSKESSYPALIHCTQGKDRTGLATLLVLLAILGEGDEEIKAIDHDYMLSNDGLKPVREEMLAEMIPLGYSEESGFADAEEGWVETVVGYIEDEGGIEKYLTNAQITAEEIRSIRECLLVNPS